MNNYTDEMRRCITDLMAKGHDEEAAVAIATTSLQIHGSPIFTFTPHVLSDGRIACCEKHFPEETTMTRNFAPPDSYAPGIAAIRAAAATPESTFEDGWKAARAEEFAAEHARFAANADERFAKRLAALEAAADYRAPDGYQLALDALKDRR